MNKLVLALATIVLLGANPEDPAAPTCRHAAETEILAIESLSRLGDTIELTVPLSPEREVLVAQRYGVILLLDAVNEWMRDNCKVN